MSTPRDVKRPSRSRRQKASDYLVQSRLPWPSLVFLMPMLVAYECGVLWLGGTGSTTIRSGADIWLRAGLRTIGLNADWLPPVLVVAGLLVWQKSERHSWKVAWETLAGMFAECVAFALLLVLLGQLQAQFFAGVFAANVVKDQVSAIVVALTEQETATLARAIGFVGAGIYEEVLFRLLLLPATVALLRYSPLSKPWIVPVAVLITSVIFSAAHHAGPSGEPFDVFRFCFRAIAGVIFAVLFVVRGFGITVGSHALYDLLVGVLLMDS
jgi:membrane protease YdiL (CAAX protease family)